MNISFFRYSGHYITTSINEIVINVASNLDATWGSIVYLTASTFNRIYPMPTRRNIITLAAVGIAMPTAFARAAMAEFTMEAFKAAQKAGKPILVDVWASWCPTCKAQGPILKSLLADPKNKDLVMLRVNFDTQTDVLKAFNVQSQSTLIVFKGAKETGRSVGDTEAGSIGALLATAI
jgi:thioredoxin 1